MEGQLRWTRAWIALFTIGAIYASPAQGEAGNQTLQSVVDLAPHTTLYSETAYHSRLDYMEHLTQLHLEALNLARIATLYGGFTVDQIFNTGLAAGETDSYAAAYPGLRVQPVSAVPVYIYGEYRRMISQDQSLPSIGHRELQDIRTGVYGYQWWDWRTLQGGFTETYGEALYSSRSGHEVSGSIWVKNGKRWLLTRRLAVDAYGEIYAARDRLGYREENRQELRPGARASVFLSSFSAAIQTSYGIGNFAARTFPASARGLVHEWQAQLLISGGI